MAESERSKVRLDAFTAKVVPDPKNPSESLLLTGFLGAATDSKQTRIYWDPSLSSHVDVDTADIIHAEPLPKEQSPLGGSYIWVKRSAEVSVSAGGQTTKGKFFQGPLMSAYGGTFGAAAGAGPGAQGAVNMLPTILCPPRPSLLFNCPLSFLHPCVSHLVACTVVQCPAPVTVACPVVSVACGVTPPGPEGQAMAAAAVPQGIASGACHLPTLLCSYARGCWFSWDACPTFFGCGPHGTPACPQVPMAAGAAQPGIAGSYAPHCWYSWDACPTMYGCGPHRTPGCPQAPMAAGAAQPAIAGSYAPHCWYSWDACPTMYGCGPHHTPGCPQAPMAAAGTAPQGIATIPACVYSYPHVCPTLGCTVVCPTPAHGCPITIHHCWPTNPQGLPC
jgi:hypothetical protein